MANVYIVKIMTFRDYGPLVFIIVTALLDGFVMKYFSGIDWIKSFIALFIESIEQRDEPIHNGLCMDVAPVVAREQQTPLQIQKVHC